MSDEADNLDLDHIAEPLRGHAVAVDNVAKDPSNVRDHPEKNKEAVKSSLREFGQRQVLVAREEQRTIEAGNLRLECARELGWSHVAVIFVDDSDLEAARYAIADNRTSDLGEWNDDDLGDILGSIDETPPGFDDDDVGELLEELEGDSDDEDLVPEPAEPPDPSLDHDYLICLYADRDVVDEIESSVKEKYSDRDSVRLDIQR